jgi:acetylornithine deacetylase
VTSHIDVVPPYIPYSVQGTTIYGRGSNDAKGSVATQIQAVEELRQSGKIGDGDVGLLYVVGEEVLSPRSGGNNRSMASVWKKLMISASFYRKVSFLANLLN